MAGSAQFSRIDVGLYRRHCGAEVRSMGSWNCVEAGFQLQCLWASHADQKCWLLNVLATQTVMAMTVETWLLRMHLETLVQSIRQRYLAMPTISERVFVAQLSTTATSRLECCIVRW